MTLPTATELIEAKLGTNDGWHSPSGSKPIPTSVKRHALRMLDDVEPHQVGDTQVVDNHWIETHTLGCRDAADVHPDNWWDDHWKIHDDLTGDSVTHLYGDASDGKFVSVTPQLKRRDMNRTSRAKLVNL